MSLRKGIKSIESRWDSADKWLKRIISTTGSLVIIIGAVVSSFNSGVIANKQPDYRDSRATVFRRYPRKFEKLKEQINESTNNTKLSTTRLELNTLITHSPTNVFRDRKGR